MVFQSWNLFHNLTALQNITEGLIYAQKRPRQEAQDIAERLLKQVGLLHKKDSYPHSLSGGQKQRIGIARALAINPAVLLLDEPTSGLHFREISQLIALLQKICDAGNTVVVIEHDMNVVASADWVIDMGPGGEDGGRILCEGTPEDIAACPESVTGRFLQKKIA